MTKKGKSKVRKTWIRNPSEQVVQNADEKKPTPRELRDEALFDYEEFNQSDESKSQD